MTEFLQHPMTILVTGTLISGVLIPWITARAQARRAAWQLKIRLVEELSLEAATYLSAMSRLMLMAHLSDSKERHLERWDDANDATNRWNVAEARMGALLRAHFARRELRERFERLAKFLADAFSMIYFTINPRNDRARAEDTYAELLRLGRELNVELDRLPADVEEYFRLASRPGPVGTMWVPIAEGATEATAELSQQILRSRIVWLEGPAPRNRD